MAIQPKLITLVEIIKNINISYITLNIIDIN
jgi:hypothetical protein